MEGVSINSERVNFLDNMVVFGGRGRYVNKMRLIYFQDFVNSGPILIECGRLIAY